jgi:septum formation protein
VVVSNVPEDVMPAESPESVAMRLARVKAMAVAARDTELPVLGADTIVVCDGAILGKPASEVEAADMLRRLSGRTHDVITALCLIHGDTVLGGIERTGVTFAALSTAEIDWYVGTGEPRDKAGAYHVDGRGALFITRIEGSPSNVAGLPVGLLRRLAAEAGLDLGLPHGGQAR